MRTQQLVSHAWNTVSLHFRNLGVIWTVASFKNRNQYKIDGLLYM